MALFSLSDMKAFVIVIVSCYLGVKRVFAQVLPFLSPRPVSPHPTPTSLSPKPAPGSCCRATTFSDLLQTSRAFISLSPLLSHPLRRFGRFLVCACPTSCPPRAAERRESSSALPGTLPSQNICQMNQPSLSAKHYSRCWEHRDELSLHEPRLQRSLAPCGEMDP